MNMPFLPVNGAFGFTGWSVNRYYADRIEYLLVAGQFLLLPLNLLSVTQK